jgi:hypothetical protein
MNLTRDDNPVRDGRPPLEARHAWLPTFVAWSQLDDAAQTRVAQRVGIPAREITRVVSSASGFASVRADIRTSLIAQLGGEQPPGPDSAIPLELFTQAHCDALEQAIGRHPGVFTDKTIVALMRRAAQRLIGEHRAIEGDLYAAHRARFREQIEHREGWYKLLREMPRK